MTIDDILKDLKARKFKPIYLLHGNEAYFIDQIVDYIENNVLSPAEQSFNQTILYGKDTDMTTVINTAKRFPMMSDYQVVIVKEAQDLKWGKDADDENSEMAQAIRYFEYPQASTILVFAYKHGAFDKRKKIYKVLANTALLFQSDEVRENKIASWIETYVKGKGYQISTQSSVLIAEYLGTDLSKITNEIDKLCLNIEQNSLITDDHIQKNIGISKEYNVFELQKALAKRQVLKCNQIINYFAANPKANPMVLVLANLYGYFTKVLRYHYLVNKADAAKELGVPPFFVSDYELASRNFSLPKVFQIIALLREYDLKSKGLDSTGNTADGALLRELIFKILH